MISLSSGICQPSCSSRPCAATRKRGQNGLPRPYRRLGNTAQLASSSSEAETTQNVGEDGRIKQTMADLDLLLGIEDKPEEEESTQENAPTDGVSIEIAPDVLKVMAEYEAKRASNAPNSPDVNKKVSDSIGRIVEQARKLSGDEEDSTAGEQAMRKEFEQLLTVLSPPRGMSQEEVKLLKDKVFGPQTFWVTETVPAPGFEEGIVVRGNFRGPRDKVFEEVCQKVAEFFGDKYLVRLVEEQDLQSFDGSAEPRIVFQIIPKADAEPAPTAGWQRGAAAVLLALTLGSAMQLGLAANVGLLPKETLAWLANPANINSDMLPPGLETFDPVPFLQSAIKVGGAALLPQLAHELGHAVVAGMKGLKTGPSFLIPNGQLGTFGSITQLKSLAKNRTDLFDFAAAGLVAGGSVSLVMFVAGLVASLGGGGAEAGLVPVPTQLFEGSLLLGGLCKFVLGVDAASRASVFVSPLLVGGWAGLVTTALNALPVGNLDGGRTMLAAYGRGTLAFTSLASYIGLGLGILGSSLALPFGLYVLICQREAERNLQDEVSEVSEKRQTVALALAVAAALILLPGLPDATDAILMGSNADFL